MPLPAKPENTKKTVTKSAVVRSMMDDAPLFAGLDDFVLSHAVREQEATAQPEQQPKEKKKSAARKTKPVTAVESPSRPVVTKPHKAESIQPGSVLLSVTEICALLKISRATLIRMDKSGKLPGRIKLGGSVRFHRETIETWLQSLISTHSVS